MTPLLKRKPASAGNYRPMSITSFFCRIFERVVGPYHVSSTAKWCHPLSQHGFMPGDSVESNMLETLNDWTEIMNNKKACDVIA